MIDWFPDKITVQEWPIAALLFAYEHADVPYASADARDISMRLLSKWTVPEDVVQRVFDFIQPSLSRETWKFYIGKLTVRFIRNCYIIKYYIANM